MELISSSCTNTEDNVFLILAQIENCNQALREILKEPCVRPSGDLNGKVLSLFASVHDFSRTLCEKLNKASELLQSTHLQQINYSATVNQILYDAATNLNKVEEQWNKMSSQYKDLPVEMFDVHGARNVLSYEDGIKNIGIPMMNDPQTDEIGEHAQHNKCEIQNTTQWDKNEDNPNVAQVPVTNTNYFNADENEGGIDPAIKHLENANQLPKSNKQMAENNFREQHQENKPGTQGLGNDKTGAEIICNGIKLTLSNQHFMETEHWAYKKYMLQIEGEDGETLACFIRAPLYILAKLQVRCMDDISSLMVSDSDELVSSILGIWSQDTDIYIPFPLSISIPFDSRYRGNYKDIMVKSTDENLQPSYLTPYSLEGYHGNHKGTFAEVKVYKLGIFSVVSCLKKENFTVPKKGISIKLSMDPRISVNYPSGCFSSSVIVQFKVQPIDTSLISLLKVKHDVYHSIISTSPLIHVKQPSVHDFQKSVTIIIPCPPNPEKKKQGEESENKRTTATLALKATGANQIRNLSASLRKHGDNHNELLKLLAYKEDQWNILEDTVVKNVQNGIVSFEVNDHAKSFIVIRLSSPMDNSHLLSFINNLQVATHSSMVNVVLYRKKDNLQKAIVEVVPSKELTWEIANLREIGYSGPPEPSEQIQLREGEQIHFQFGGNITASDGKKLRKTFQLTYHTQKKQRLSLNLGIVDEFGNYSSPHYKGTVAFYKLCKEDIVACYKRNQKSEDYLQQQNLVCKLAVTLPKVEKNVSRPSSTKITSSDPADALWDNLLHWLAGELSEEDMSLLVLSLPIRRSTVQLIKLKSPDNLNGQIYELLSFWKKSLPASADKRRLLARHLRKSGRNDLLEKLKIYWETQMSVLT
ncbi:hypothetical protein GDO86_000275 [Hymenochirus boettgeri]|uniref:Death domain-containing protein n=1 Tax=Hymenochirus boettgeri TaxID=247094 RepID=A0A8T2KAC3_9PIPI|nr:hypothetical protein GDO86_000275 [Hymenochirus boettgeri]